MGSGDKIHSKYKCYYVLVGHDKDKSIEAQSIFFKWLLTSLSTILSYFKQTVKCLHLWVTHLKISQGFPYWDMGVPTLAKNLLTHPPPTPYFSCYNPIKTLFLVAFPYFSLTLYSLTLYTQVMLILINNQCSIFKECCFWLWKRFEWSNTLLLRFPREIKKSPPAKFSIPSHPLMVFGKPFLMCKLVNVFIRKKCLMKLTMLGSLLK